MFSKNQRDVLNVLLLLIMAIPLIANAGDTPSTSELLEAASFDLKRPLKADSIEITATRKQGTGATLVVKQKFSMKVSFSEDTYKKSGKLGVNEVLSVVTKKGSDTTLYGTAESNRSGASWTTKFQFENDIDYGAWGSPKSVFPGKTVVSGSPEEQKLLVAIKTEKENVEKRKNAAADLSKAMEAERLALKNQKEKERALNWEKDFSALTERIERGPHSQRMDEIKKSFRTADKKLHKRLMAFMSKNDDLDIRSIALRMKIDKAGKLEGRVNNGNPNIDAKYPLNGGFKILSINIDTGDLEGNIPSLKQNLSGSIDAEKVVMKNKSCKLLLKLTDENNMRGDLSCVPSFAGRKLILYLPE